MPCGRPGRGKRYGLPIRPPSPLLGSVKDGDNHDLVFRLIEFMHDNVRQAGHGPFVGAGDGADVSDLRKFTEPLGLGEDARRDADRSLRTAAGYKRCWRL